MDLRLYDGEDRPVERALLRPWDPKGPHLKLVVLSIRVRETDHMPAARLERLVACGLAEEVHRYPTYLTAITDCDALVRDPAKLARLHRVADAALLVVYDADCWEARRQPIVRLVPKGQPRRSWWRKLLGWGT